MFISWSLLCHYWGFNDPTTWEIVVIVLLIWHRLCSFFTFFFLVCICFNFRYGPGNTQRKNWRKKTRNNNNQNCLSCKSVSRRMSQICAHRHTRAYFFTIVPWPQIMVWHVDNVAREKCKLSTTSACAAHLYTYSSIICSVHICNIYIYKWIRKKERPRIYRRKWTREL